MKPALPLLVLLALALAAPPTLAAPQAPKQIRDSVKAAMEEGGDETGPQPGMFEVVDINRDGKPDWKVDYGGGEDPSMWCGTGGCSVELWASQPGGGWSKVMDQLVRGVEITHPNGGTRLDLQFHGSTCGAGGAYDCQRSYFWDEDIGWKPIANKAGSTWLYDGPVELNLYGRTDKPAEVDATLHRLQAACPAGGGEAELNLLSYQRIADISGDGKADWVVGGGYNTCASGRPEEAIPMVVLISQPDGGLKPAFERARVTFGLDIGQTPAAFYVIPVDATCGEEDEDFDRPCGARLRWDAARGRLTE